MSREVATFLRALVGLALVGAAVLIVLFAAATNRTLLGSLLPGIVGLCAWVGVRIIVSAYRDATRVR